jgi:hypothetical protein
MGEVDPGAGPMFDAGSLLERGDNLKEQELGRRVHAEVTNDFGVEASAREALGERRDLLDQFDQVGFTVAFALAWGHASANDPTLPEEELSRLAADAADLSLRAGHTPGGWEAMVAGAGSEIDAWSGVVATFLGSAA